MVRLAKELEILVGQAVFGCFVLQSQAQRLVCLAASQKSHLLLPGLEHSNVVLPVMTQSLRPSQIQLLLQAHLA